MRVDCRLYVRDLALAATLFAAVGLSSAAYAGDQNSLENMKYPKFALDPSWPKPLPAPVTNGVAHPWVQGEVAGNCVDLHDNVYTFNRGWEVGVTYPASGGVLQGNQSGAIVGQDASASAIPSPPIVVFDSDGNTIAGFGNPTLVQGPDPNFGYPTYLPHGSHGCFVDYQGYLWVGGNGDGVIQKYNPQAAAKAGANAQFVTQIGTHAQCDGPPAAPGSLTYSSCGDAASFNTSHTLLNEPADMAVDPNPDPVTHTRGSVYIADGYGNHRVVVFTTNDGGKTYQYSRQWGTSCDHVGQDCPAGTFGKTGGGHPHCIVLGNDGLVYVCDRPNSRIQVFDKSCGGPSTPGTPGVQPMCTPRRIINIGLTAGVTPPAGSDGNNAFRLANPANAAAIQLAGTRGDDMDFWPNIDPLASQSPTSQRVIVNVDLGNDNTWLIDKATATVFGALGVCGIMPCPGHNGGHFAFGHTAAVDSNGNIYIAETITGRRIQKFTPVGSGHGNGDGNSQH
jgi:hypothetical protein